MAGCDGLLDRQEIPDTVLELVFYFAERPNIMLFPVFAIQAVNARSKAGIMFFKISKAVRRRSTISVFAAVAGTTLFIE